MRLEFEHDKGPKGCGLVSLVAEREEEKNRAARLFYTGQGYSLQSQEFMRLFRYNGPIFGMMDCGGFSVTPNCDDIVGAQFRIEVKPDELPLHMLLGEKRGEYIPFICGQAAYEEIKKTLTGAGVHIIGEVPIHDPQYITQAMEKMHSIAQHANLQSALKSLEKLAQEYASHIQ